MCMNATVRVAKSYLWGELEKTGTSIETGTAAAPAACPTFFDLAFRRGKGEKKRKKELGLLEITIFKRKKFLSYELDSINV